MPGSCGAGAASGVGGDARGLQGTGMTRTAGLMFWGRDDLEQGLRRSQPRWGMRGIMRLSGAGFERGRAMGENPMGLRCGGRKSLGGLGAPQEERCSGDH